MVTPRASGWRCLFLILCGATETLCPTGAHARPQPRGAAGATLPPLPCVPAPPGLPGVAAGGAEGCRTTDGLVSLAGAGGSTDSDYSGGRYHRDHGVSSGMAGWDGVGGACAPITPLSLCLTGRVAETGTIAGIASALAMALIGAVSSYISYQQKKFCFSIQQGLNAEYVKGENMEAVVSEEPQVKYSVLETQSAEPPKQDSGKI
uniref:CD99 antigen-like protein 2 n=1 Tax=Otus sunia TaxID=257818 RepID=A0A8C8E8X2_9STRI